MLVIRPPKRTDSVKAYRDFICELINEGTYLLIDRKPSMREEKKWFREKLLAIRKRQLIYLGTGGGKKLIAAGEARRGPYKDRSNVSIGISVLKKYRGRGLGEKLLRSVITLAKKKFKPKNIYLQVAAKNKPALNLYKKVGFKIFAKFPKWSLHKGKYIDDLYMIFKK